MLFKRQLQTKPNSCKFCFVVQPIEPVIGPSGPFNSTQPAMPPSFSNEMFHRNFDFENEPDHKRMCYNYDNRIPLECPLPNRNMEFSSPLELAHQQPHWLLINELENLRKSLADLNRLNEELQATHEFLMRQNTQLRLNQQAAMHKNQQTVSTIRTMTRVPVNLTGTSVPMTPIQVTPVVSGPNLPLPVNVSFSSGPCTLSNHRYVSNNI